MSAPCELEAACVCHRTYDSSAGPRRSPRLETAEFWHGETYACHSGCDGHVSVRDRFGRVQSLPNAAFAAYLRHA